MILVVGATGFIGRALVRQLDIAGYPIRALIRPSSKSPRLPKGVPMEVSVVSLSDTRGLRAAMRGVKTVFHLASAENQGARGNLQIVDIDGTKNLAEAAADAGVERFVYLSHVGAAASSGYAAFRAKGLAEEAIRAAKTPYTVIRSSLVYGAEDHFTTNLARLIRAAPGMFPVAKGGRAVVQPIWVEDLATCMIWTLQNEHSLNQTYELGGNEFFTLQQIVEIIMDVTRQRRILVLLSPIVLRALAIFLESVVPNFPISSLFLDYFAVNRAAAVDAMTRHFGLMPARFSHRLDYLIRKRWYQRLWDALRRKA